MSIFTVETRITRQYLERKTKSDLAQMYLDLLDITCAAEKQIEILKAELAAERDMGVPMRTEQEEKR